MLNTISWQQYLTATASLLMAWYIYIGLRYYRTELVSMLRLQVSPKNRLSLFSQPQASVMGAVQPDSGTAVLDPDELHFGTSEPDDISDVTVPPGPADEFLAEAEMLIEAFHETDDKPGFLSLFKVLIGKYAIYNEEIDLETILIPLKSRADSQLPFHLNDKEWPATWPKA